MAYRTRSMTKDLGNQFKNSLTTYEQVIMKKDNSDMKAISFAKKENDLLDMLRNGMVAGENDLKFCMKNGETVEISRYD